MDEGMYVMYGTVHEKGNDNNLSQLMVFEELNKLICQHLTENR